MIEVAPPGYDALDPALLAVGIGVVLVTVGLLRWLFARLWGRRLSAEERASWKRHRAAQQRSPPVEIGDVCEVGIKEFTNHHSGERRAVGKVEGFVVFVEDVPPDVALADVVRIKILSYNRGRTSATATYVDRA